MARTAKKQAPAKVEDDDDAEGWEDAVVEADKDGDADLRLRDWRDVERFREMKDLRRLVDDDYGLEAIFHIPLKPRTEGPPRTKLVVPAKAAKAGAPAKAAAPTKAPAKPEPKTAAKAAHAPTKKAVPAKAKAKPKAQNTKAKAKKR